MTANASNDLHQGSRRVCASILQGLRRDLLRVKGGVTDYCVIGKIDVQAVRQFQGSHRLPAKLVKPLHNEFEINFGRKVLPAREKQ